ncbi:hypothetical protein B0H11DRAFT_1922235 [Mycena galericulata]|nr:hypothetical protein B0H11DRAFT_1922235 [Mycena galericulata]
MSAEVSSNIPAAGKVTGGRRWPPVTLGGHWQMLMDAVSRGVPVGAKILEIELSVSEAMSWPENAGKTPVKLFVTNEPQQVPLAHPKELGQCEPLETDGPQWILLAHGKEIPPARPNENQFKQAEFE